MTDNNVKFTKYKIEDYDLSELVATLMCNPNPDYANKIFNILDERFQELSWVDFDKNDKSTWPGNRHTVMMFCEGETSDDAQKAIFFDGEFYDVDVFVDDCEPLESPKAYFYLPYKK